MKIIRIKGKLDEKQIEEYNSIAPIIIEIESTKDLNASLLRNLDKSIRIRIVSEKEIEKSENGIKDVDKQNEKDEKSKNVIAFENSLYEPDDLANAISILEGIEKEINPEWSDLEKAIYTYITLEGSMSYCDDKEYSSAPNYNNLISLSKGKGTSRGIATIFHEAMTRQDINSRVISRRNMNSWNEIEIDGKYYPLDLSMDVIYHEDVKSEGRYGICNFITDKNFYNNPNHETDEEVNRNSYDLETVQIALKRVNEEKIKALEEKFIVRERPVLKVKSEAFNSISENGEITSEVLDKIQSLKIDIAKNNKDELVEDIKNIGKFYPEVLRSVELENTSSNSINMQEIVDSVYEARQDLSGTQESNEDFTITISSSNIEDFNLDFSKAPNSANINGPTEGKIGQRIILKNTGASAIKIPNFNSKLSSNIDSIELEDFDLTDLTLGDANIDKVIIKGQKTQNTGAIELDANNSHKFVVEDIRETELNQFLAGPLLTNNIYAIEINRINLRDRAILGELAKASKYLCEIGITNCYLNNLDGLEDFDGRISELNLSNNNLTLSDLDRVNAFCKNNPFLRPYLHDNLDILNAISRTNISKETSDYLLNYFNNTLNKNLFSDRQVYDFLLGGERNIPYYIKDAKAMRENLHLTHLPMMLENDNEIDSINFDDPIYSDGKLLLTVSQIERLLSSGKKIPQDVYIKIEGAKDLDSANTQRLYNEMRNRGMNLAGVQVIRDKNWDTDFCSIGTYSIAEYSYARDTLDMLVEGIDLSEPDVDKFATIYTRICDSIAYDNGANTYSDTKGSMYCNSKVYSSRTMAESLCEGQCVCAGYADTLRNALELVGVESRWIRGACKVDSVTRRKIRMACMESSKN